MEVGCPMPEAAQVPSAAGVGSSAQRAPEPNTRTPLALPAASHECVFAELCAPTPPAVAQVGSTLVTDLPEHPLVGWPPAHTLPTESPAPPVPPPRS